MDPTSPDQSSKTPGSPASRVSLELNTDYATAERFPAWMALSVFSAVCVAALESRVSVITADQQGEKWALAVTITSLVLSFVAVVMYLMFRSVFVSQMPETIMIGLLIAFWAAGLPTIMNPGNRLAVSKPDNAELAPLVTNANLYFFAWLSLAAAVALSGSLLQEYIGVNVRTATSAKAARWYGLVATSLIVMGSAVRTFTTSDCEQPQDTEVEYCRRTKFAVSIGVIGFFFALAMTYMTQKGLTLVAEMSLSTFQLCIWCFGIGYTTFGESPGATIGNLYFSTWISFILTVFIFAQGFREYVAGREAVAAQVNGGGDPTEGTLADSP